MLAWLVLACKTVLEAVAYKMALVEVAGSFVVLAEDHKLV